MDNYTTAITAPGNTPSSPTNTAKPPEATPTNNPKSPLDSFLTIGTPFIKAAPLLSSAAVNDIWRVSGKVTRPFDDQVTKYFLDSGGGWGNLKPEQIDQVSDQLANFMIKKGNLGVGELTVEEIKSQARQVLESMEPPLGESTIAELLEGSKGLFSGNPGSLNYVDPTTGMNKIDTLLASFGEKYKDVLVQINSGSVKSEDEAKGLIESFRKEMIGYIKENFFGDERGDGKFGLALKGRAEDVKAGKDAENNNFKAGIDISKSPDDEEGYNRSGEVALILGVSSSSDS
jgi:hypothetical protein